MEAIYNFLTFLLIIFAALVVVGILIAMMASANQSAIKEQQEKQRRETETADAEYDGVCDALRLQHLPDCDIYGRASVNSRPGFVALSNDGRSLRYLTWGREGNGVFDVIERTYSTRQIVGLTIEQPTEARVVVHKEKTPVAVNVRRSAGGRALVGGIVAGPAGAIIGGASGLNGKTKIKMVDTERRETVYKKGRGTLIVQLDDMHTPRRAMKFATVEETNDWSARIHAAMQRARA